VGDAKVVALSPDNISELGLFCVSKARFRNILKEELG
jgi:hypothetical protein